MQQRLKISLSIVLLFFVFIQTSQAANFGLSKSKIRLSIAAGESQAGEVKVENTSGEPLNVKAYIEDWSYAQAQDGSKNFLPAKTHALSAADFISFAPSEFVIPPYGSKQVNYVVRLPENAQGGYYVVMFFETGLGKYNAPAELSTDNREVGIDVALRLACLFFIEVKGKSELKADFTKYNLSMESGKLTVAINIKDSGNIDMTAGGMFDVLDSKGMVYARGVLSDVYLFPGDEGLIKGVWSEKLNAGKYSMLLTMNIGKARAEAEFGRGTVIVKEAELVVDETGAITSVGDFR